MNYGAKDEELRKNETTVIQKNLQKNKDVMYSEVKEKLEKFQFHFKEELDNVIEEIKQGIIQDIENNKIAIENKNFDYTQKNDIWNLQTKYSSKSKIDSSNLSDHKKHQSSNGLRQKTLQEKQFIVRDSYLTVLLEIDHMKSIYNFFYVLLIFMFMYNTVYSYVKEERLNIGLYTIRVGFGKFHLVLLFWLMLHVPVLAVFYAFKIWAVVRNILDSNNYYQSIWNYTCLTMFMSFILIFGYFGCLSCSKFDLPLISCACILMETFRLIMKMHAFVRSNIQKELSSKKENSNKSLNSILKQFPLLHGYIYYLFSPTLIYRDLYPRTKKIRWSFVFSRLFEIIAVIFLISFVHERYLRPNFINFGKVQQKPGDILISLFGAMIPGLVIFLCGFYCILHAWLNFTAEILKFGDRVFYKNWWTAGNYNEYYRHWNIVVHDYLFEYVYKDVYNHVCKKSKTASQFVVFLVSALIHEIIISCGLRFVYPVMFFFFMGIGGVLILVTRNTPYTIGNIIILSGAGMGNGMMMAFYYMEYYARQNCLVSQDTSNWMNIFKWVSWSCNGLHLEKSN